MAAKLTERQEKLFRPVEYQPETDPNKRPVISGTDGYYLARSIERLAILADVIRFKHRSQAVEALRKYGHVLLDRQREVLEQHYGGSANGNGRG